jgi:hypothetical protein
MHSPTAAILTSFEFRISFKKKGMGFEIMQKKSMRLFIFLFVCYLALCLSSCSVVSGIFKAGMVWGIFLVVAFIALIVFLIAKASGGKK